MKGVLSQNQFSPHLMEIWNIPVLSIISSVSMIIQEEIQWIQEWTLWEDIITQSDIKIEAITNNRDIILWIATKTKAINIVHITIKINTTPTEIQCLTNSDRIEILCSTQWTTIQWTLLKTLWILVSQINIKTIPDIHLMEIVEIIKADTNNEWTNLLNDLNYSLFF